MTDHQVMRFDWEEIKHLPVSAVLGRNQAPLSDGVFRCDEIAFVIGEKAVLVSVCCDTDQIWVDLGEPPHGDGWSPAEPLAFAIGQVFGWCWVGIKYLGYKDSFYVAFGDGVPDALTPRLTFVAAASSLTCLNLTEVAA